MNIVRLSWHLLLYLTLTLIIFSCGWNDKYEPFTTDLEVIVQDESLKTVADVNVYLYRSEFDMLAHLYPEFQGVTNSEGLVVFEDIDPMNYFVYAFKNIGDEYHDNSKKGFEVGSDLIEGALTQVKVQIAYKRPIVPTTFSIDEIRLIHYEEDLDSNRWLEISLYKMNSFDTEEDPIYVAKDFLIDRRHYWDSLFHYGLINHSFYQENLPNILLQNVKIDDFDAEGFVEYGIIDIEKTYPFMEEKMRQRFPLSALEDKMLILSWTELYKREGQIALTDYPYGAVLSGDSNTRDNAYYNLDKLNVHPVGPDLPPYPDAVRIEFTFPRKGTIDIHLKWE